MQTRLEQEGKFWADKLMDLANLIAVVLVFGQIGPEIAHWNIVIFGCILYMLITLTSYLLRRR